MATQSLLLRLFLADLAPKDLRQQTALLAFGKACDAHEILHPGPTAHYCDRGLGRGVVGDGEDDDFEMARQVLFP